MYAGEEIEISIDTRFGTDNLLPSDYSFVVWAEEQPVDIWNIDKNEVEKEFGIELLDLSKMDNIDFGIITVEHEDYSNIKGKNFLRLFEKCQKIIAKIKLIQRHLFTQDLIHQGFQEKFFTIRQKNNDRSHSKKSQRKFC